MSQKKKNHKKVAKKRKKKVTLYVSAHGRVSVDHDLENHVLVCQSVLDKFGIKENRRELNRSVVTEIVLSIESVTHGQCMTWTQWEALDTKEKKQ